MSFDHKITDLKLHINKLVPKYICDYFINVYEENKHLDYFHNKNLMVSTNYNVINYLAKSKEFIDMF